MAAVIIPTSQAHYIFSILKHNGKQVSGDYTYIRKNTNTYMPSFTSEIVNFPELRCNKGATNAASQTYTVNAGDKIGFKIWFNELIEHPGPAFVYMSKAPGSVSSYDVSGDWFKVWESGLCGSRSPGQDTSWCTWQKEGIEFTIPKKFPSGEWLVRAEHIAIHEGHIGKAQFYMERAQLKINGGGDGVGSPAAKIPGVYSANDPGIAYNKWYNPPPYVMPGGPIATFGNSSKTDTGFSNVIIPGKDSAVGEEGVQVELRGQCGGSGYTGSTRCAEGGSCKSIAGFFSLGFPSTG